MFVVGLVVCIVAFMWRKTAHHPEPSAGQEEMDFDVLTLLRHVFLHSLLFYGAFIGALLFGCSIVAFWPSMGIRVP
jgi:hypothetical protein